MMMDAATPSDRVNTSRGAMIRDSMNTAAITTAAPIDDTGIVGMLNRSRVLATETPRSRSWGRINSTMNSRIIGAALRTFPAQSNRFGKMPIGGLNVIRVTMPRISAPA